MAIVRGQQLLQMATRVAFVVGVLHVMQHTIALAEARDCGCISSGADVCGADGKWYSSMCQAMCEGVQAGYNRGECNGIGQCERGCLARVTFPIKVGSPDYCTTPCPFPPYPPLNYNVKIDGPDVCYVYRRQCRAVCSATRVNPVFGLTEADDFFNKCYQKCCHLKNCSIFDSK